MNSLRLTLVVLVLVEPIACDLEYELAVPSCLQNHFESSLCVGARRADLDIWGLEILASLETDCQCVSEVLGEEGLLQLSPVNKVQTRLLATCVLPAVLSFEVFAAAANLRARCDGSLGLSAASGPCAANFFLDTLKRAFDRFSAESAAAAAALELTVDTTPMARRFVHEQAGSAGKIIAALKAQFYVDHLTPLQLAGAALETAQTLGLSRRVLMWQSNLLHDLAGFGLTAYLPMLSFHREFLPSRLEVLFQLLGGPPAEGRVLVEVGVHLARLGFALLSNLRGLSYVGVDPFVYDGVPESTARQLRDLGLLPEAEGGAGERQLWGEVRSAAEAKLALFPGRARLLVSSSTEGARQVADRSVDGVFIDGDHSYPMVARDLAAWEPKVRRGGFLSGHDFGNHPEVARAVLEFAAARNRTVQLAMDWVWYWRV